MDLANENKEIVYLDVEHIFPHPDNPRVDLGNLDELIESIKVNGLLQNLTVIPSEDEPGEYITLIGHRRYSAAVQAGLTSLPCTILEGTTRQEQIAIMLEENMLREDLSISEEANSFQLMLDLGSSISEISEKSGFSQSTVKHRIKLAELDKDILKEKVNDTSFQMNLTDLYELEKISDIEKKNEILKSATSSNGLKYAINNALKDEMVKTRSEAIREKCKNLGITEGGPELQDSVYSSSYRTVDMIPLDTEDFDIESINLNVDETEFFIIKYRKYYGMKKLVTEKKKEVDPKEKEKKRLKEVIENYFSERSAFVNQIIAGDLHASNKIKNEEGLLWNMLLKGGIYLNISNFVSWAGYSQNYYNLSNNERESLENKVYNLSIREQMLVLTDYLMSKSMNYLSYNCEANAKSIDAQKTYEEYLSLYDWKCNNEDIIKIMDGTHSIFNNNKTNTSEDAA